MAFDVKVEKKLEMSEDGKMRLAYKNFAINSEQKWKQNQRAGHKYSNQEIREKKAEIRKSIKRQKETIAELKGELKQLKVISFREYKQGRRDITYADYVKQSYTDIKERIDESKEGDTFYGYGIVLTPEQKRIIHGK